MRIFFEPTFPEKNKNKKMTGIWSVYQLIQGEQWGKTKLVFTISLMRLHTNHFCAEQIESAIQ